MTSPANLTALNAKTNGAGKSLDFLLYKGGVDYRNAIIAVLQAQAHMFAYSTKHNILDTMEHYEDINVEIHKIGLQSNEIKQILTKTRMLSINASIEAAHVGAAGKGFGVVAEEIGVLSNQTKTCTDEVEKISTSMFEHANTSMQILNGLEDGLESFFKATDDLTRHLKELTKIDENGFILTTLAKRLENHADFMHKLILNAGKRHQIADHHTCAFGVWFDKNADKYKNVPAIKKIGETHRDFHTTAIEFNETVNEQALGRLVEHSSEIVDDFLQLDAWFREDIARNPDGYMV